MPHTFVFTYHRFRDLWSGSQLRWWDILIKDCCNPTIPLSGWLWRIFSPRYLEHLGTMTEGKADSLAWQLFLSVVQWQKLGVASNMSLFCRGGRFCTCGGGAAGFCDRWFLTLEATCHSSPNPPMCFWWSWTDCRPVVFAARRRVIRCKTEDKNNMHSL